MSHAKILINFHYVVVVAKAILIFFSAALARSLRQQMQGQMLGCRPITQTHTLSVYYVCIWR